MVEQTAPEFTEDEAELYDRQIRLWGLDAQRRLRSSKVLVVGARGLGAEVCKNIVLAGIKSLTLLESAMITEEHGSSQFLVDTVKDAGKNLADCSLANLRQLNPMVEIVADAGDVDSKSDDYFLGYDVVVLTNSSSKTSIRVNNVCRRRGIKVLVADVFGVFGYVFVDLGANHEYAEEIGAVAASQATTDEDVQPPHKKFRHDTIVKKHVSFASLEESLSSEWLSDPSSMNKSKSRRVQSTYIVMLVLNRFRSDFGRRPERGDTEALLKIRDKILQENGFELQSSIEDDDYIGYCCGDLNAVCTIIGGVLAQEIIKAVSHKDKPHKNFFFFNGRFSELGGHVENIC